MLDLERPGIVADRLGLRYARVRASRATSADAAPSFESQQPPRAINLKQCAERDVTEILGIVKGLLADGVLNDEELRYLTAWGQSRRDAIRRWPSKTIGTTNGRLVPMRPSRR